MRKANALVVGALAGAMFATPVLAASQDACLQQNRIKTWKAVDEKTLVFTDLRDNKYTVATLNTCQGVKRPGSIIVQHRWGGDLQCLYRGNIFYVIGPGLLESTCSIASITAGAPANAG